MQTNAVDVINTPGALANIEADWTDAQVLTEARELMAHWADNAPNGDVTYDCTPEDVAALMRQWRDDLANAYGWDE